MVIQCDFKNKTWVIDHKTVPTLKESYAAQSQSNYQDVLDRLVTRFGEDMPAHFEKCISMPQSQPYMHGDAHNVEWASKGTHWNSPHPVPCEVTSQSCRTVNGVLTLGALCEKGVDEPFQWMDLKIRVTLNFLKSLSNGTELRIYTRSDLVAHDDYIVELKRLSVDVTLLCASTDDHINRLREPGAPSYKRRLEAYHKLGASGIRVSLKLHSIPSKTRSA